MATVHIKSDYPEKVFEVNVQINPLPDNCMECPFYQCFGEDDWGNNAFGCILCLIHDEFGIGVHRYKYCPLDKKEKQ